MNVARVFAVLSTALMTVVMTGASAMAATPSTWDDPAPISTLELLAILVGGPLALYLGITAIAAIANRKLNHHVVEIPSAEVDTVEH